MISLPYLETYFNETNYKILKYCDPYTIFSNLMRNFDSWHYNCKAYLSNIKQFRITMRKIFSKQNNDLYQDFSNVFLDDNQEVYYKEKFCNQISFCISNNNKENCFVELKYLQ